MEENQWQDRRLYDKHVAILEERLRIFIETTTDWRKSQLDMFKDMIKELGSIKTEMQQLVITIAKLPCDARRPMWDSLNKQVIALWGFVGAIVLAVIYDWIKGR